MKMWSGRFGRPLNPEFESWQRSFGFDKRLLGEELAASRAHARALKAAGVLSEDELKAILGGLDSIADQPVEDDEAEDIHHYVEKQLVAAIGDTGLKLHSGRSRNEQIATDLRLYVRNRVDELIELIQELCEVIVERATEADTAAMPAYTHLQPAEPVLVAHWLLSWMEMFLRDAARLLDCRERVNLCPLGSGAIAGTVLPLDRVQVAFELGFAGITANSIDATCDRDFAIEFAQTVALMGMHLSRWAEEFILFSTREYGFVGLPETYATGSSAMPQKKNPDSLELIRGKAGRLVGNATTLLVTLKGLPLAYNKDLQETQEPVFDSGENAVSAMRIAIGFLRDVEFNFERMTAAANTGFMNAFAAATYLVRKGVPFRRAHEQVGRAVRLAIQKGCELQELSLDELRQFGPEFDGDFFEQMKLAAVLDTHDVAGGTAPARVHQSLNYARQRVSAILGGKYAYA
jgi:argininosuccinate lyase